MERTAKDKILSIVLDTRLFRIIYLITLSFEMIAFCDSVAIIFRCAVLAWGGLILIFKFIVVPRAFKIKYRWLLWGFIAIGIFTSLWNISIDFLPNMVFVYHTITCFFIFYSMRAERNHEAIEKEMIFMFKYFILFSTVTAFLGIVLAILKAQLNIGSYFLGILRNRLVGIHTNSNLLAFSNIAGIFSVDVLKDSHLRWKYSGKCFNGIFLTVCCIINFLSLFLSDSNASFLFIVIYFTVRVFYTSFVNYKEFKISELIRGSLLMIVCSALMISGSFLLRDISQEAIGIVINDIHKIDEPVTDNVPQEIITETQPEEENANDEEITIGRENYDVSSGRITLLRQGIKLFRVSPIIGIGRGNLVGYGEKYLENGLIFSDLHNGYLTILVSYGIVGFTIFMIFSVFTATDMCKYVFKFSYRGDSNIYSKIFSAIIAYCAYSLFEKAILSEITFMVVFFWLIIGYANSYIHNGTEQESQYKIES